MDKIDYRENRWEGCKAYHIAGMKMDEVDPACPMLKYIADHLKLTIDQRFWLAWLYSTCYSAPTAFYMITHIPTSRTLDPVEMKIWWAAHKKYLVFESDRRYVRNMDEFPKMFESYRRYTAVGEYKAFARQKKGSPGETYEAIYKDVEKKLYFFGRYSIFMYLETIYNLTKFPMMATGLNLRQARTSRNGVCFALGKDHWARKEKEAVRLNADQYKYLQYHLKRLYNELKSEHPEVPTTYWNLETSLCAYYKLFKPTRYAGYYIDRQMTEIEKMQKLAPKGADWSLLWKFRKEHFNPKALGEVMGYKGIRKEKMDYFLKTGQYVEEPMPSVDYQ